MLNNSVAKIVKGFIKIQKKLEAHSKKQEERMIELHTKIVTLEDQHFTCAKEASQARKIAVKI